MTVIYKAGFEVGNMSEIYANSGGEELDGSSGAGFIEGTDGTTVLTGPNGEFAQVLTEQAHSGTHSAKLVIPTTAESGVRVMRWAEPNAYDELFFQWWVYLPQAYAVGVGGWSTFAQITSKNQGATLENPFWAIGYTQPASSGDGKPHFNLQWLSNSGEAGPQSGMNGADVTYLFPDPLPVGRWVQMDMHVKAAGDFTGTVEVWQDRVLQKSFRGNVKTIYPNGTWNTFALLIYGANVTPTPYYYYIDDFSIWTPEYATRITESASQWLARPLSNLSFPSNSQA